MVGHKMENATDFSEITEVQLPPDRSYGAGSWELFEDGRGEDEEQRLFVLVNSGFCCRHGAILRIRHSDPAEPQQRIER